MASITQIANLVGVLVGTEANVTSLDDDRPLPRNLKAVWDMQRRATIRDGEFNFAVRRTSLPALASDAPYPWSSHFRMPADAIRLLEVLNVDARSDYQLEGGTILCEAAAPLYIRYLADVPEPAEWDDQFADAFAHRLAWKIGDRIAGSAYDTANGYTLYRKTLAETRRNDARENPPIEQEESDWILARNVGGAW